MACPLYQSSLVREENIFAVLCDKCLGIKVLEYEIHFDE